MSISERWLKFVNESKGNVNFSLPMHECCALPKGTRLLHLSDRRTLSKVDNKMLDSVFNVALVSSENRSDDPVADCCFQTILSQSLSLLIDSFRGNVDREKSNHQKIHTTFVYTDEQQGVPTNR